MHPSLQPYEDRVAKGLIRKVTQGKLVLYNYTDACTFERAWDEYTMSARGIIFEQDTGKCVARPFKKFFNLGENGQTIPQNEGYEIWDKMDGSLGILFWYAGEWNVATRGSFTSTQAIEGKKIMLARYHMDVVPKDLTLLTEIIYPENKIIVNYGQDRELVLLGAIRTETGEDLRLDHSFSSDVEFMLYTGMQCAPKRIITIEQAIEAQKTLPKDREGFVVRFDSGLRIKVKGEEYLKIAKILSHLSPLSLWECMKDGKVESAYLSQIPEEFRHEWEPIRDQLEYEYRAILEEIKADSFLLERLNLRERRDIGIYVQSHLDNFKHPSAIFAFLQGKTDGYIMKQIRPTGNVL